MPPLCHGAWSTSHSTTFCRGHNIQQQSIHINSISYRTTPYIGIAPQGNKSCLCFPATDGLASLMMFTVPVDMHILQRPRLLLLPIAILLTVLRVHHRWTSKKLPSAKLIYFFWVINSWDVYINSHSKVKSENIYFAITRVLHNILSMYTFPILSPLLWRKIK